MLVEVSKHALMITGFVFVMMLVIEYLNVATRGRWDSLIRRSRRGQVVLASGLGSVPGCLGAFASVSFYGHGVISFGALTASMIATCGDETFVMLALFPGKTLVILGVLFVLGIGVGALTDIVFRGRSTRQDPHSSGYSTVHGEEERCVCFSRTEILGQWRRLSPQRGILAVFLVMFLLGIVSGEIGHHDLGVSEEAGHHHAWNWVRLTLLLSVLVGLFVVATVPEHFLEEHLWNHLAKVHVWRIFVWTFGTLLVMHVMLDHLNMAPVLKKSPWAVLVIACLVGVIPQSGPHLLFVTLFAQGTIPFSILLASCIVQDGHGMIPLLAHSRRAFAAVKAINVVVGLGVGAVGLLMGW